MVYETKDDRIRKKMSKRLRDLIPKYGKTEAYAIVGRWAKQKLYPKKKQTKIKKYTKPKKITQQKKPTPKIYKYYQDYMLLTGKTRQAINSDFGKQAENKSGQGWGGRRTDGTYDNKRHKFLYDKKINGIRHYPNYIRKTWPSYGKKY